MKKLVTLLLIGALVLSFSACVSRENYAPPEESSVTTLENVESSPVSEEEIVPETTAYTPEEISKNISIVAGLLENATKCDMVYRGTLPVDEVLPGKSIEDSTYLLVVSEDYIDLSYIEKLFSSTFDLEGKSRTAYDNLVSSQLYMNFNGELHMKEHDAQSLPPLTMGKWDISTASLVEYDEDHIWVKMETQLVGQANDLRELEIVKKDDIWLLNDSFFLD